MKKFTFLLVLLAVCLLAPASRSYADDTILTRKIHRADYYVFGKGSMEGEVVSHTSVDDTITRKKLSSGILGPFSVGVGFGGYSGSAYFDGEELGEFDFNQNVSSLYLGYRKDLADIDLFVFYMKPGMQINSKMTDFGFDVSTVNLDFGMDMYELEGLTFFCETGLNYASWKNNSMTGALGFDFNMGAYITDNFATGMKVNILRGGNYPVLVSSPPPQYDMTDVMLTNVAWFFEIR